MPFVNYLDMPEHNQATHSGRGGYGAVDGCGVKAWVWAAALERLCHSGVMGQWGKDGLNQA